MDNVCHTLVGAAFAEAGLKRRTRYAHAVAIVGANLPDLDVLVFATDLPSVAFRRGWTHGLLAQATLPIALTLVALMVSRLRGSRDSGPPADVRLLLILSYLGVGSHVFLDFLNNYGIRLLAPFEWRWFYGDAVFIIDPWLWLALGTGVWLTRRRGSAGPAWGALAFAACYTLLMLMSARAARDVVADTWRQARGGELHALMVGPMPITPLHRAVIVDAGDRYETGTFDWVRGAVTFDPTPVAKNANRREVAIAREAPNVRAFLVWSRFPFWELRATAEGTLVTVRDMRFTGRAGGGFAASTVVPARDHGAGPAAPREMQRPPSAGSESIDESSLPGITGHGDTEARRKAEERGERFVDLLTVLEGEGPVRAGSAAVRGSSRPADRSR